MRPPGTKRLRVVGAALAYVLLLGVPVWWRTTSLHRPPLPHEQMQAVAASAASRPAFLPVALEVVVVAAGEPPAAAAVHEAVQAVIAARQRDAPVALSVSVTSAAGAARGQCSRHPPADGTPACLSDLAGARAAPGGGDGLQAQQDYDDWLAAQQADAGTPLPPGSYRLFVLPSSGGANAAPALVVGRHRHAWLGYRPQQRGGAAAAAAAGAASALACCFALHAGAPGLAAAGALPVSAAGETQLSFSLLNADPSGGTGGGSTGGGGTGGGGAYTWDFEAGLEAPYLAPLAAALAPVAALCVESQVLAYTRARSAGEWSERHAAYVVKGSQLPFFIDSEWPVGGGRAPPLAPAGPAAAPAGGGSGGAAGDGGALLEPHVLHLLVFVPPAGRRPLLLLGRKGRVRDSNSYLIPSWGGLLVLNPDGGAADGGGGAAAAANSSSSSSSSCTRWQPPRQLQSSDYSHIAAVVVAQLQALFGVAPAGVGTQGAAGGAAPELTTLPAGRAGFAAWQLDALLRQRAAYGVQQAASVLGGLSRLAQQLPNLEMPDVIGQQVGQALANISAARSALTAGDYARAARAASAAHAAAEAAFLHPSVLAQYNFPDSHKLGVYMPLFLPVSVPLLQGAVSQLARYARRRRAYAAHLAAAGG